MEEHLPQADKTAIAGDSSAPTAGGARTHAREFLDSHRQRLEQIESSLTEHLKALAEEFAQDQSETHRERGLLDRKATSLAQHGQDLSRLQQELESQRAQWEEMQARTVADQKAQAERLGQEQAQLEARREQLAASEARLREEQRTFANEREEHRAGAEQFAHRRQRIDELERRLEREREEVESLQAETKSQRRRIAAELRETREAAIEELETRQREIEKLQTAKGSELDQAVADLRAQVAQLQTDLKKSRAATVEAAADTAKLTAEVATLRADAEKANADIAKVVAQRDQVMVAFDKLQQDTAKNTPDLAELANLRGEQESFMARLADAEAATAEASAAAQDATAEAAKASAEVTKLTAERDHTQAAYDELQREAAASMKTVSDALAQAQAEQELLVARLAEAEAQAAQAKAQAETAASAEGARVSAEVAAATAQRDEIQTAYDKLLRDSASGTENVNEELANLRTERDTLLARVAEAEAKAATEPAASQQTADLQRRFEMAVEDVRDLKRRNAELEEQMASVKAGGAQQADDDGPLDWEACKRRLMASLEADDAPSGDERLTIEGTIRITDEVVARKDREVKQLNCRLQELESAAGAGTSSAEAVERSDAISLNDDVRAEREKLQQLQQELQDKLRQAEIDISIERAKIARERAQLEEKLQKMEEEEAQRVANAPILPGQPAPQPTRGRWLERLGLKDTDEKKS